MTPSSHVPVMVSEVLQYLGVRAGGRYIDATVGLGGHAEAILEASSPGGQLVGCDIDPEAVEGAQQRLQRFGDRVQILRCSYEELADRLPLEQWDGVLFDLGAGSYHFDRPERGFSFQKDGPLDMRFDPETEETAADIVNRASFEELVELFKEVGEEPFARRIARAIERQRQLAPIRTTRELALLTERVVPVRPQKIHPATRVFMALRIRVNRELERLRRGLDVARRLLKPGGRLVCITFHSGEVRVVREFGRRWSRDYDYPGEVDVPELRQPRPPQLRWVVDHAIRPTEEEIEQNPRARSASLFVLEKLALDEKEGGRE